MDAEAIKDQLKGISEEIEKEKDALESSFEKLVVAISNVFRLVDGEQVSLTTLQSSPKMLRGYVLNLVTHIQQMAINHNAHLLEEINGLMARIGLNH